MRADFTSALMMTGYFCTNFLKGVFFSSPTLGELDLYSSGFVIVRAGIIAIGRTKLCHLDEKVTY